jgi:hypothetical protein
MKNSIGILGLWIGFVPFVLFGQGNTQTKSCIPCEQLNDIRLPDVTILKTESLMKDTTNGITVPFCRVTGRISKEINFELILPQQWNGRFLMSGGGGFVGEIQNYLRDRANDGYASVGTDTGHQGSGISAEWALDNMERQLNFGRLAIHRTAVVSKSLIHSYYCAGPSYSYFSGCSRGGGQSMVEAQFYPEDFDGFVTGAPAFSWPAIGAKFIQVSQKNYPNPKDLSNPVITNDNLKLLQEIVLRQCDNLDGLTDKIINDPRNCNFDFSKLPLCPDNKAGSTCFTKEQLAAIKSVYSPVLVDQKMIYPGFPYGLEGEVGSWDAWISGTSPYLQKTPSLHYMFSSGMYKYLIYNDPSWDYSQYDFKNYFEETRYASSYLDATQTDYTEFKKLKRKMIMYHGWNDPALSALATIQHYEEALQKDKDLPSSIRLFLLPGVLHCGGGSGPDNIDWIKQIQNWVENNQAPDRLVMSKMEKGKAVMTRPVYPYPKVAMYNGSGDPNQEKNFKVKAN